MRKLLFSIVLLIVAISFTAAQTDSTIYRLSFTPVAMKALDTITNTGTGYVTWLVKQPTNEAVGIAVEAIAANLSGTTDIDVNYQSSLDGTNFFTVASDSLASGNLTYIHEDIDGFTGRYIRCQYTGVGTQSSTIQFYIYAFKIPGSR